jgi:hypothetical protein
LRRSGEHCRSPTVVELEKEDAVVNEETQRRAIMILSTGIAGMLSSRLADKFIDIPEERGIGDDLKEALLKAAFSVTATIMASIVIRRVVGSRWGS